MKKIKNRRFSNMIVIMPVCIIAFVFTLVFLCFHFSINQYIGSLTQENIKIQFRVLDEIFQQVENDDYILWGMEDSSMMIPVEYMILDKENDVIFSSEYFYMKKGLDTAEFLAGRITKQRVMQDGQAGQAAKIRMEDKTYLVSAKQYEGVYQDDFVVKAEAGEQAESYLYVVYLDITTLQKLINTVDYGLLAILMGAGLLTILFIFYRIRKIRISFHSLEQYLIKIGKREKIQEIPQFSYEEFTHIVETINEMSDRIAQSEQLQKQFFQNASHELRTPLMSIQGYAEGLKYHVMQDTEGCCDVILQESKRMSALVDEILFLSKFETQALQKDRIEVKDMLYTCANQVYLSRYHQIEIAWDVPDDITMVGDETLLQRAISNILSNALRYAKSKVCITAAMEKDTVEIHIIDDGDGITPEDFPHIFERFYKGKGGNFGIGLSMTRDIIEKHHGTITVESEPGHTDFCIALPTA